MDSLRPKVGDEIVTEAVSPSPRPEALAEVESLLLGFGKLLPSIA
jgi:hypothetical protein